MTRHVLLALLAFMLSLPCALAQYGEIRLWEGTNVHEKGVTLLPFIAQENRFDGAAIIAENKILAARCILPVSDNTNSRSAIQRYHSHFTRRHS